MNLENIKPDTSSKLSFFLIIIVMGIFGFIQDFIFDSKSEGDLTPVFLISFIIFSALVYLNYRYNEYMKFYLSQVSLKPSPLGFFIILVILIFFIVTPNSLIKVVGINTWIFIFTIIFIFIFTFLIAGIIKYKKLISDLIEIEINHFNSKEDIKIKNFILENKRNMSKEELISDLKEYKYDIEQIRILVHLMCTELPLI
jgi:hypothetical protein